MSEGGHTEQQQAVELVDSAVSFCGAVLGLTNAEWQLRVLSLIDRGSEQKRVKIALKAPNEAGKSRRVIGPAALRWLSRYPRGRVRITSKDGKQIADQVWPGIARYRDRFTYWEFLDGTHQIRTNQGGHLRAFTTTEGSRIEGAHEDEQEASPLFIAVDEAHSIDPQIIQDIDRCAYNVLLYISRPGEKRGPFYEAFTSNRSTFITVAVTLGECPWITPEKIADIKRTYGEQSAFARSALYGEFMEQDDEFEHAFRLNWVEAALKRVESRVELGPQRAFIDWGGGKAETAIAIARGNEILPIIAWRDPNEMASVGRAILELRKAHVPAASVSGDDSGLGAPMNRRMAEMGYAIYPVNNGAAANDRWHYKNRGTELWLATAAAMQKGELLMPDDPVLISQLTSRRVHTLSDGRRELETKLQMKERGLASPDRADAMCGAWATKPFTQTGAYARVREMEAHVISSSRVGTDGGPGNSFSRRAGLNGATSIKGADAGW